MSNPLPIYCGHHRSGSTWIFRVLRELVEDSIGERVLQARGEAEFGADLATVRERLGVSVVSYINANYAWLRDVEVRGVHVVRDPRDLLVSAYWAHAVSHPTDGWPELEEFRRLLAGCSEDEGLLLEMEFCANVFEDMRSWPDDPPGIELLRFEEMIEAPLPAFARIARQLGFAARLPPGALERVVGAHGFRELAGGRMRGEPDPSSHYRRGQAGEWRERMRPIHRWAFEMRWGDLLRKYDYERDAAWVRS